MWSTNVNYPSSEQAVDVLFTVEACGGKEIAVVWPSLVAL